MAVRLYMDHNVRRPITAGLRLRGIDVLTAFEDGSHELDDPDILDRVGEFGRVLYTEDDDFLTEGATRDLELIAKASEPEDLRNQVLYLPLR